MMSSLEAYLADRRKLIEAALSGYLRRETDAPRRLIEAMEYSLLAPGKRIRPLLVVTVAEACGGRVESVLPAACALEMVHAYSLVHDDLPAMDDDDLRRGRPTCHKQFDEATAILVGDGLLTLAFQAIAEGIEPPQLAAICCRELARGAGVAGMVGGQMEDLHWENRGGGTLETLQNIHRMKTGALIRGSVRLGAILGLGSLSDPRFPSLDRYGTKLGLAFQIADDLLDVQGSQAETGKKVGKDAQRGKLTYPVLLGVSESRARLVTVCDEAISALAHFGVAAEHLRGLVTLVRDRNS